MNAFEPAAVAEPPRAEADPIRPPVFLMIDKFETGGSERQAVFAARALRSANYDVNLGCMRRTGAFLEGLGDVAEFDMGGSFFGRRAPRAYLALARHLRTHRIAVAHSFDFYSNVMMIPIARAAGVPVVIGSHRQIGDLLRPRQFQAQAMCFRLSDRVVCNSRAAAGRLLAHGLPQRKLEVISNGLPDEAFGEAPPALPREPDLLRVGMIARMNHPVKNYPGFLRAAARLTGRFPQVEFLLVGDGPLRPELELLASRLGLRDRVRFLGDRRDIPAVLAAMDILVAPSFSESLSNVILEAMAAAIPVVATRVGGNPEVVIEGETGLLVPPDSEEALAGATERLLTQPSLRAHCGEQARRFARAHFTLDRVRNQYCQLYATLLEEKGWSQAPEDRKAVAVPSGPLRVAIVAASPRWIGGHGVQADLLMRSWQNDPAVRARFVPIDPELPRWVSWVEHVPLLRTIVRQPFYYAALWGGMRDAEIVHIFAASYWSFLLAPVPAWWAARRCGKKALINYHSGEARDHLSHWRSALPILRRADRLVVPSQYLVDVFREFGLRAEAVPNIFDASQFCYRVRRPLLPSLVCTRGFHPYYSVGLVVQAFAAVKKEFPEARLCLVGAGSEEKVVRAQVRESRLAGVEFAGAVTHREIGRFYRNSGIFINASWLDNMPISILEAFACGTPVVSTAPEGIRYLVEHERTGLLCEPGDWEALAGNVIRLLRDPELAERLASNAHEESARYQWGAVREQWLRVYRSLQKVEAGSGGRIARPAGGGRRDTGKNLADLGQQV